jgi:hypothetical protein
MSDRITAIIPRDATLQVDLDLLDLARRIVVGYLINKDPWAHYHVNVHWYEATKLFKECPEDVFAEYEWMQIQCNLCQKDVKDWWYQTIGQLPDYEQLNLPCPCKKEVINLNRLTYEWIDLYFVKFSIRIWHSASLLTREEFTSMMDELENLLECELQTTHGRY